MRKYRAERWLDPEELSKAEQRFIEILDLAYSQAKGALVGGLEGRCQQEKFNRIFKPI